MKELSFQRPKKNVTRLIQKTSKMVKYVSVLKSQTLIRHEVLVGDYAVLEFKKNGEKRGIYQTWSYELVNFIFPILNWRVKIIFTKRPVYIHISIPKNVF